MYIKHLSLLNYKNLQEAELSFRNGINCLVGKNGAGKTNLLDALYYLSFCKSYFNAMDSQLVRHDQEFFMIQGRYHYQGQEEEIYAGLKKGQKKQFKRNKKEYQRLSEHIGLLPLVLISPGDERLITEGSDQRRKYLDGVLSQFDRSYLSAVLRYNRGLAQRNSLLKNGGRNWKSVAGQLEVWDSLLAQTGLHIYDARTRFIAELEPVFQKFHRFISGGGEEVQMVYHSHHQRGVLEDLLKDCLERDAALGYTTRGVHRDDLELLLDGHPVRKVGSQGQKKTFFLALKLAQFEFLSGHFGFAPILLLDDMFDKLDDERAERLIELVGRPEFEQIFITHTQKERLMEIVQRTGKPYDFFVVNNGDIRADEETL